MELRTYWNIFRRRWLLAVIPAAIVIVISLITYEAPPQTYNTGVRFIVGQPLTPAAAAEDEERYYAWLTSEYVVNGLTDWVRGNTFATAVSAELAERGVEVPPYEIGIAADNARSMLTLSMNHSDPERLAAIMEATITVLKEQNAEALPQLGGESAVLTQLDTPTVNPIPAGIRSQLDLPLRVVIAIGLGIALALVVEYLDPRIHGRDDLQTMELEILGEIPKK